MLAFEADDGLGVQTDVYQDLCIPDGTQAYWKGGSSPVRTCHAPRFAAVCFLPSSPTVTTALVAEGECEAAYIDAATTACVVSHG